MNLCTHINSPYLCMSFSPPFHFSLSPCFFLHLPLSAFLSVSVRLCPYMSLGLYVPRCPYMSLAVPLCPSRSLYILSPFLRLSLSPPISHISPTPAIPPPLSLSLPLPLRSYISPSPLPFPPPSLYFSLSLSLPSLSQSMVIHSSLHNNNYIVLVTVFSVSFWRINMY